jgi:3-hydroxyacyl-[acyl-carrier-protein] dehydratase
MKDVLSSIPHRPPFLFVDKIVELTDNSIKTTKEITPAESFFEGHYPGNPIMPGVLICESIFQTGAVLLSNIITDISEGTPVLTRISNGKFKNIVRPGSTLEIEVEIVERVSNAFFMKGKASVEGKLAVSVEFGVAMAQAGI